MFPVCFVSVHLKEAQTHRMQQHFLILFLCFFFNLPHTVLTWNELCSLTMFLVMTFITGWNFYVLFFIFIYLFFIK